MTGPEHYREAERLLSGIVGDASPTVLGKAQVHATLALAAAAALNDAETGLDRTERSAWDDAAGTPWTPEAGI